MNSVTSWREVLDAALGSLRRDHAITSSSSTTFFDLVGYEAELSSMALGGSNDEECHGLGGGGGGGGGDDDGAILDPTTFLAMFPTQREGCAFLASFVPYAGHRLAIYEAASNHVQGAADGFSRQQTQVSEGVSMEFSSTFVATTSARRGLGCDDDDSEAILGSTTATSNIWSSQASSRETDVKRILQLCQQKLHSKAQDALVQLHRPHTVTKRVHKPPHLLSKFLGTSTATAAIPTGLNSRTRPEIVTSSSSFSPTGTASSQIKKMHGSPAGDSYQSPRNIGMMEAEQVQAFTWIDITGSWDDGYSSAAKTAENGEGATHSQSSFFRPRRHASQLSAAVDRSSMQDFGSNREGMPLLSQPPRPEIVSSPPVTPALQRSTLEDVILKTEAEFEINMPLAAIVHRAHALSASVNPSAEGTGKQHQEQHNNGTRRRAGTSAQTAQMRSCVEIGIRQGYISGMMFSSTIGEDQEGVDKNASSAGADGKKVHGSINNDSMASLDGDLSHQHVFVLDSPTSFISPEAKAEIFPPNGSEQRSNANKESKNFVALALDTFLDKKRSTVIGPFAEPWVVYVDFAKAVVVTIRPTDCIPISKMRSSFDDLFGRVGFGNFLWCLVDACAVNYGSYLSQMYDLIDECETLMAPTMVEKTRRAALSMKQKDEAMKAGTNTTTDAERERRSKHNISYSGPIGLIMSIATRIARSVWRKVSRRRTLPRDLTVATLRLMNLIYRQCSVCRRSLERSKGITANMSRVQYDEANLSAEEGKEVHKTQAERLLAAAAPKSMTTRRFLSTWTSSRVSQKGAAFDRDDRLKELQEMRRKRHHGHQHSHGMNHGDGDHTCGGGQHDKEEGEDDGDTHNVMAEAAEAISVNKYIDEMIERIGQIRHTSGELMNLSMALHGEFYDQGLSIVACVCAIFVPLTWVNGIMSMNFYCIVTLQNWGYFLLIGVYVAFVVVVGRFLMTRLTGSS